MKQQVDETNQQRIWAEQVLKERPFIPTPNQFSETKATLFNSYVTPKITQIDPVLLRNGVLHDLTLDQQSRYIELRKHIEETSKVTVNKSNKNLTVTQGQEYGWFSTTKQLRRSLVKHSKPKRETPIR